MSSAPALPSGGDRTALRIGVLALQGDVREHERALESLGAEDELAEDG